ncbi:SDR family NAD(P)-dependent oxidoreductase [Tessaracoccus antarcticus]|uniref:SDR family NAD(P)-dependent oxidoreductase n=1 Tax=Tessaracoccus antarcticus TaxID=2479848 RepID=A0A3M0GLJ7_9ACTN|nr:SDR family NAD(P)-dependent oxidoreductase [Tessaracoccus antarcticus]RMB62513.1 SDR family NAD(P)-dependent oxidoreductase [Tessaracoccus antarcticus]
MTHWTLADMPDQTGKRWLITGATNGLGEATARAAAGAGATLVLPARRVDRAEELNREWGGRHEVVHLDLASLQSVRDAAAAISGDIDVLVNNAGMVARHREETVDGFEKTLGTNFLGPFALTNLLLPQVRERVVILGSDAHLSAHFDHEDPHFRNRRWGIFPSYGESKLADMLWGLGLSKRLRGRGIGVQLVHPGWVLSNLQSAVGNPRVEKVITTISRPIAQSAEKSALCTLFAATADLPECSYVGPDGLRALRGWPSLIGRSAEASDMRGADRLWEMGVREAGTDV